MPLLNAQLRQPASVLRPVVRWLLARDTPALAAWGVELLAPGLTDRVLELGISLGLPLAAGFTRQGLAVAVDPSPVLLARAQDRNTTAIREGRMQFHLAQLPTLPFESGSFDRVFAVNNIQLWPDLPACLTEVRRVLRPGGRVVLVVHPCWITEPDAASDYVRALSGGVLRAGFLEPAIFTMGLGAVPAYALVAHSPTGSP